MIRPPHSKMGPCEEKVRQLLIKKSPVWGEYEEPIDRSSAYEKLKTRSEPNDTKPATSNRFLTGIAELVGRQIGYRMNK